MTYLEIIDGQPKVINVTDDKDLVITDEQSVTDLIMACREQEIDKIIIDKKFVTPAFFEFNSPVPETLSKHFESFQMRLVIFGDFPHQAKLQELADRLEVVTFAPSREAALAMFRH